ncbi:hypothetical protein AB0F11_07880 [Streptomyces sp. NPDC032472]|uniref:hypothetical protein n=1 Tax=Streptomyces sp. NPDC032472 TaxID=3155018 RepID=UPI0033D4BC63
MTGRHADGQVAPAIGHITDAAGVGKTGLAVRWARRVAEQYPDGRLFADLQGYDEHQPSTAAGDIPVPIPGHFLRSLGAAGCGPASAVTRGARSAP